MWRRQLQSWQFSNGPYYSIDAWVDGLNQSNIDSFIFKSHQQTNFIGNNYDPHPLGIKNVADVVKRCEQFRSRGIDAHSWCVPMGHRFDQEVNIAVDILKNTGEITFNYEWGWSEFWERPPIEFVYFIQEIRNRTADTKINVCFDTVYRKYSDLLVSQWAPMVDALEPELYPVDFGWTATYTLEHAWKQLAVYGVEKFVPCLGMNMGANVMTSEVGPWLEQHGVTRVTGWVAHTSTPATRNALGNILLAEVEEEEMNPKLRNYLTELNRVLIGWRNEFEKLSQGHPEAPTVTRLAEVLDQMSGDKNGLQKNGELSWAKEALEYVK